MNKKDYENKMKQLKECKADEVMDALNEIIDDIKIPKKLYRYRPLNLYTIDEIINRHVFLSNPNIDDLFDTNIVNNGGEVEGIWAAYYISKYYREQSSEMDKSFKFYNSYFEELNKEMRENIKITCFTESNTNVPMWQYYADKHMGVCLEYSISKNDFGNSIYFLPVIYTNDYNKYLPDHLLERKEKLLFILCSVLKMQEWEFEKEWRIVSLDNKEKNKPQYVNAKITGIYCGVNMPEPIKSVLKGLIDEKIPIYEMKKELTGLEILGLN